MFDTISQYIDNLPWWGWVLFILALFIFGSMLFEEEEVLDTNGVPVVEDDYPANWEDTITCTVPGQQPIILRPTEFYDYEEYYTGVYGVTLRNRNTIFLPMQYTTILDSSMDITTI